MSDIDVLRVPEPEPKVHPIHEYTKRSWWCRKFHDKHMRLVGYTYDADTPKPIRVCRLCVILGLLHKRFREAKEEI